VYATAVAGCMIINNFPAQQSKPTGIVEHAPAIAHKGVDTYCTVIVYPAACKGCTVRDMVTCMDTPAIVGGYIIVQAATMHKQMVVWGANTGTQMEAAAIKSPVIANFDFAINKGPYVATHPYPAAGAICNIVRNRACCHVKMSASAKPVKMHAATS